MATRYKQTASLMIIAYHTYFAIIQVVWRWIATPFPHTLYVLLFTCSVRNQPTWLHLWTQQTTRLSRPPLSAATLVLATPQQFHHQRNYHQEYDWTFHASPQISINKFILILWYAHYCKFNVKNTMFSGENENLCLLSISWHLLYKQQ